MLNGPTELASSAERASSWAKTPGAGSGAESDSDLGADAGAESGADSGAGTEDATSLAARASWSCRK